MLEGGGGRGGEGGELAWGWACYVRWISTFRIYKQPQFFDVIFRREHNFRGPLLSEVYLKRMAITCLPLLVV